MPFSGLTTATNIQAAMVVGSGASLTYFGGIPADATINANQLLGATWEAPGQIGLTGPNTGAFTSLSSNNTSNIGQGSGVVTINSFRGA